MAELSTAQPQSPRAGYTVAEGTERPACLTGAQALKPAVPDPNKAANFLRGLTATAGGPGLSEEDAKLSPEQLSAVLAERKKQNTQVCAVVCLQCL